MLHVQPVRAARTHTHVAISNLFKAMAEALLYHSFFQPDQLLAVVLQCTSAAVL